MDVPMKGKCVRLLQDAFEALLDSRSIPFNDIVSHTQTLGHHSPAASNLQTNVADHWVLNDARVSFGEIAGLEGIWQGVLCDGKFNMALKYRHRDCFSWQTYMVCGRVEVSSGGVANCFSEGFRPPT